MAAVASQVLNVYLRAVSVELKAREQLEPIERLEAWEEQLERHRAEAYVIINLREDQRCYAEAPRCLLGSLRAPLRTSLAGGL